jgi:hypothetical protein
LDRTKFDTSGRLARNDQNIFGLAVPLLGFVVATVASIVSAEEKHLAASTIALSFWGLVCVGVPLSELVIPRGPQMYDKYVSGQLFRIPWHYAPETDFTKPNGFGFTVGVCPNTPQLGVYDEGCRSAASRVTVAPGTGYENQNGLITCQNYSCRRRIVVDGFVIDYTADLPVDDSDDKPPNRQPANTRWTDADHNLAALVMSWKDGRATSTSSAR